MFHYPSSGVLFQHCIVEAITQHFYASANESNNYSENIEKDYLRLPKMDSKPPLETTKIFVPQLVVFRNFFWILVLHPVKLFLSNS
jgi:hypothetical protein